MNQRAQSPPLRTAANPALSKAWATPFKEKRPDALETLLDQSIEVVYLESGSILTQGMPWTSRPHTVVAQSVEEGVWVMPEGEEQILAPPGGGYILPEGMRFRLAYGGDSPPHYLAHFAHYRFRVLGELDLFHFIQSPYAVNENVASRLTLLSRRLARTLKGPPDMLVARALERRRLCVDVLSLVLSVSRLRPGAMETVAALMRLTTVLRYMREQMARPIFSYELAEMAGLSQSHFRAIFLAATRQSPMQYLNEIRIRAAQQLLVTTKRPVAEIGQAVGYRDLVHFSQTFKRYNGQSPREFRRHGGAMMTDDR